MFDEPKDDNNVEGENLINHAEEEGAIDAELEKLEEEIMAMTEEEIEKDPAKQEKLKEYNLNKAKETIEQKRHWREKAQKKQEATPKPEEKKPEAKKPAQQSSQDDDLRRREERIDFRLEHPEIAKPMLEQVEKYARANNLTLEQAIQEPFVKKAIEDKKVKEQVLAASPTSKHRSSTQSSSPKDWSSASLAEIAAHRAEILSRAGRG